MVDLKYFDTHLTDQTSGFLCLNLFLLILVELLKIGHEQRDQQFPELIQLELS